MAVLYGGVSDERYVSLSSVKEVLKVLNSLNIKIYSYDMKYFSISDFLRKKYDVVFILVHGKGGEDGSIQSLLDYNNIYYTSSGLLSSYITFDKFKTKVILNNFNIKVVPSYSVNIISFEKYFFYNYLYNFFCNSVLFNLGLPLIMKPNFGGSSIGVLIINSFYDLSLNLKKFIYKYKNILIEKFISGEEYTVGILNDRVLPFIRIEKTGLFYDYKSKYKFNSSRYFCPVKLSNSLYFLLNNLSINIWKILGCKNIGRIDFILDKYDNFWFLELNTIPGMTKFSLLPLAARSIGINFVDLIKKILYIY